MTSEKVQRYDWKWRGHDNGQMSPDDEGQFVSYSDYAALLQRAEAAEADARRFRWAVESKQFQYWLNTSSEEGARAAIDAALEEVPCSTHPDAPHGFNRNGSHNAGRYVCDCEGWIPPVDDEHAEGGRE